MIDDRGSVAVENGWSGSLPKASDIEGSDWRGAAGGIISSSLDVRAVFGGDIMPVGLVVGGFSNDRELEDRNRKEDESDGPEKVWLGREGYSAASRFILSDRSKPMGGREVLQTG